MTSVVVNNNRFICGTGSSKLSRVLNASVYSGLSSSEKMNLVNDKISMFKIRSDFVDDYSGEIHPVIEYSIEKLDECPKFNSAYNGEVPIPVSGDDYLICNLVFPNDGTKIQIVVLDGDDMSEDQFVSENLSSDWAIKNFATRVNTGDRYFRIARARENPSLVNAFYGIVKYNQMLYSIFNRKGLANRSHCLVSVGNIHFTNAFWTGFCMCFGNARDSNGEILPLTATDVCGHELSHGLQTFTTEFVYEGESGALNESIADVFGTYLEAWINSPVDTPDWTMGEQFQFIIRDLSNPKRKQQPVEIRGEHWVSPRNLSYDNGGVHINSGVTNFMCYLASNGSDGKKLYNERGESFGPFVVPKIYNRTFGLGDYVIILYNLLVSRKMSTRSDLSTFAKEFIQFAEKVMSTSKVSNSKEIADYINECASFGGMVRSKHVPEQKQPDRGGRSDGGCHCPWPNWPWPSWPVVSSRNNYCYYGYPAFPMMLTYL